MSKKHFIALADYLRDTKNYCEAFTPAQLKHRPISPAPASAGDAGGTLANPARVPAGNSNP